MTFEPEILDFVLKNYWKTICVFKIYLYKPGSFSWVFDINLKVQDIIDQKPINHKKLNLLLKYYHH